MDEKQRIFNKIKTVYSALQKPNSWYTGLAIKRYLQLKVFSLQTPEFKNPAITAGRWSTYCHYSIKKAFINLVEKNHIGYSSPVVVHPLTPKELIEVLKQKEAEIIFQDISKTTLNFDPRILANLINSRLNTKPVELIVHYGFNGLYEEISTCCQNFKVIPSISIIDNPELNLSLLELFEKQTSGGVIWSFGDSFLDDQLNVVMDVNLESQSWFLSWQIEDRTRSVLEYHLSESHKEILPIIEAYFYLLLDKYKQLNFLGSIYQSLVNIIYFKNKFKNRDEPLQIIKNNYRKFYEIALPDLIFELEAVSPEQNRLQPSSETLVIDSGLLQNKAKDLYDFFQERITTRKKGTLEIPDYYLDRAYLRYFVFTNENNFWIEELKQYGINTGHNFYPHPSVIQSSYLPNAQLVANYGLFMDVTAAIKS